MLRSMLAAAPVSEARAGSQCLLLLGCMLLVNG